MFNLKNKKLFFKNKHKKNISFYKNNKTITTKCDFQLEFDLDFINEKTLDGCFCSKCKDFFPYSVPNQDDGITMICWACRNLWI